MIVLLMYWFIDKDVYDIFETAEQMQKLGNNFAVPGSNLNVAFLQIS